MKAEVTFKGVAFPESLRWRGGDLWFSDVLAGVVYRGDIATGELHTEAEIPPLVSGLGWLHSGELLVVDCEKKAVVRQKLSGELAIYSDFSSHWKFSANDMLVDSDETVWVGTYGFNPEGDSPVPADLARIAKGVIDFPISGLVFANGIARIDDSRIVVAETFADRISIIQTSGEVKLLKHIQLPGNATPDGLVVDNQGCAWVASAYGEAVRGVYDCTFGGVNLDKLYVATSTIDETHVLRDLPGEILCFDLTTDYPGLQGMGNK